MNKEIEGHQTNFDKFEKQIKEINWNFEIQDNSAPTVRSQAKIRNAYTCFHILSTVEPSRAREIWNRCTPYKVCLNCGEVLFGNRPLICKRCGHVNNVC